MEKAERLSELEDEQEVYEMLFSSFKIPDEITDMHVAAAK